MIKKMSNPKFRKLLREHYKKETEDAIKNNDSRIDPYALTDWSNIFTPIENNVWHDIRVIGIPMWPQYPILNYFIDFADPIKKIAIEVDGKEFHKDLEKDKKRQREIENLGWTFYRIEGWRTLYDWNNCYDNCDWDNEEDVKKCDEKFNTSSEYIIRQIKKIHYENPTSR